MLKRLAILCATALGMIALGIALVLRLLSEGSMPSKATARGIRDDVAIWARKSGSMTGQGELPARVLRLKPLNVELVDGGVLLIFHRRFVEDRGYFYAVGATDPPEELRWFCRNVGDGVYLYYNPG